MVTQPRIAGGTLIPAGNADFTLAPEVTPLSVSTLPESGFAGLWWKFTAPQTGRLNFDSMLSMNDDGTRTGDDPATTIEVFLAADFTLLEIAISGVDPQQGFTLRGSVALTVQAGVDYLIYIPSGGPYLRVLRVSDWAEATDWADTDDVVTICAPDTQTTSYDEVAIPPDELLHRSGTNPAVTYEGVVTPLVDALGWYGRAGIDHSPSFDGDPHPYEDSRNWEAIYNAAANGPVTTDAVDGGATPRVFGWDTPIIADSAFPERPIGLHVYSSPQDSTPPDGHQSLEEEMYAQHHFYNFTRMIEGGGGSFSGPVHQQVRADSPVTDDPGVGAILDWEEPTPSLRDIELHTARRNDSPYNPEGSIYGEFDWYVGLNPLEFEEDPDADNGHWRIGHEFTDPMFGTTGMAFRGRDIVDGQIDPTLPEEDIEDTIHAYGGEPPDVRGDLVLDIPGDDDDGDISHEDCANWHSIGDEATVLALLAREKEAQYPTDEDPDLFFSATHQIGGMMISGIPAFLRPGSLVPPPDIGLDAETFWWSLYQYVAIRLTWHRPRHRWVFPPIVPPVGPGVIPPRRISKRSDGATHGARRVGAGNTRQSGSRTLGAIL